MYITYYKPNNAQQMEISLKDILENNKIIITNTQNTGYHKVTRYTEHDLYRNDAILELQTKARSKIIRLSEQADTFLKEDMSEYYHTFKIPKKTKGYRTINAPNEELKDLQRQIKSLFEKTLKMLPNDAAYAYVTGRSTVDALKLHQAHKSRWFLKLDLKNFFPSHNFEYIMSILKQIYPTCALLNTPLKPHIEKIIKVCLLNDELPQGTPVSPTLTNILMVPIDYQIQKFCTEYGNEHDQFMTYTRYADDIIISSTKAFEWGTVKSKITYIINENSAPFKINSDKTRYGSNAGRNWNNGIMYNKDMQLTIGHKNNQKFRATLYQFISDNLTESTKWNILEVQQFLGKIAYYKAIEPEYISFTINKYSTKFGIDFKDFTRELLTE